MISKEQHLQKLKQMYESAPINQTHFTGTEIVFDKNEAVISFHSNESLNHAMGFGHGLVAFKMLDDSAYFAAQVTEKEFFLLTASFTLHFVRPIPATPIRAVGILRQHSKNLWVSESRLFDAENKELAFGTGSFMKSKVLLESVKNYF